MQRKLAIFSLNLLTMVIIIMMLLIIAVFLSWHRFIPNPFYIWDSLAMKDKPTTVYAQTGPTALKVLKSGQWEDIFVKGVNIGTALPGKWFTEFPRDEGLYMSWLEKIGQMNANAIRVYTLLPPEFYKALENYNDNHPDNPLWLLQEIWPEENPPGHDYLQKKYVDDYFWEIENAINAIHGRSYIPDRNGRAHGIYTSDVSKFVLGYLVGRELEPEEVIATNEKHPGFTYTGDYFSTCPGASPTEAWLAMNCNYLAQYEEQHYRILHPIAIVSWPTLDIQEHDSEWNEFGLKSLQYNDKVAIDINNIICEPKMKAGFFGAYHIYPNYPDFINYEIKYDNYQDATGRLRYGGYLQEFLANHTKYPALVAEFGLSTSMESAHISPDGLNHGGLTEEQQGNGIVRMMQAIKNEGYAGALIFEWMDEWAKKTWTTEPYMIPYERHVLWHNAIDPEQNYGLLAMEPQIPASKPHISQGSGAINRLSINHDARFLYLDVIFDRQPDFSTRNIIIGLDTYARNKGEFRFSPQLNIPAPGGLEFIIDFSGPQNAEILVHPGYNTAKNRYSSYASAQGIFEKIQPLVNKAAIDKNGHNFPAVNENGSRLVYGTFDDNADTNWHWAGNTLRMRIPWGKLNFSDPSSLMVLEDSSAITNPGRDNLGTEKTEGIMISVLLYDSQKQQKIDLLSTTTAYKWQQWDTPVYKERLKKSYFIIQKYFDSIKLT